MYPHLKKDFLKLVEKYLNGSASAEEIKAIEDYYSQFSNDADITDRLHLDEIIALKASPPVEYRSSDNPGSKADCTCLQKKIIPVCGINFSVSDAFLVGGKPAQA